MKIIVQAIFNHIEQKQQRFELLTVTQTKLFVDMLDTNPNVDNWGFVGCSANALGFNVNQWRKITNVN